MKVIIDRSIVTLTKPKAAGAVGDLYDHPGDPNWMIKVYRKRSDVDERRLLALISQPISPLTEAGIFTYGWPEQLVLDAHSGQVVGFSMRKIEGAIPLKAMLDSRFRLPEMTHAWFLEVAISLLTRIHVLHLERLCVFDFNPNNFLVHRSGAVTQIDIDSLCFADSSGRIFGADRWRPEFLPPELQCVRSPFNGAEQHHDAWAALTLVHVIFRGGFHPFDGDWRGAGPRPPVIDNLRRGIWPDSGFHSEYLPRRGAPPFRNLDKALQDLSWRMFERGLRNPAARPTSTEILNCLNGMRSAVALRRKEIPKHIWTTQLNGSPLPCQPVTRVATNKASASPHGAAPRASMLKRCVAHTRRMLVATRLFVTSRVLAVRNNALSQIAKLKAKAPSIKKIALMTLLHLICAASMAWIESSIHRSDWRPSLTSDKRDPVRHRRRPSLESTQPLTNQRPARTPVLWATKPIVSEQTQRKGER